jgi:hypothetical protein
LYLWTVHSSLSHAWMTVAIDSFWIIFIGLASYKKAPYSAD